MHILPQLREIEKQYPDDVAVIGVHSGKYIAERETSRIREASLRYEITHPMYVADSEKHTVSAVDLQTGSGSTPKTREARTWLRGFHEPGGVAAAERCAYIADTDAHRIMIADYESGPLRVLEIAS